MKAEETYNELIALLSEKLVFLADKPGENPQSTLDALWHFSCESQGITQVAADFHLPELTPEAFQLLRELIDKRIGGTPLAHLIGLQVFMEVGFMVDASALIPRKETEILGYSALGKIRACALKQPEVHVMDICTGLGNLALAFAVHEPKAQVLAGDISQKAIDLARRNTARLSLENRVQFFAGDMFSPFNLEELSDSIDIMTCNPPYISNSRLAKMPDEIVGYEPIEAFNGGSFGLTIIFRLIRESIAYIKNGGWLCFEVGLGQGDAVARVMERNPAFSAIEKSLDAEGNIRAISAQVKKMMV